MSEQDNQYFHEIVLNRELMNDLHDAMQEDIREMEQKLYNQVVAE